MSHDEYGMGNQTPTFKVIIIGNIGVGKTSLLFRFAEDTFTENYNSSLTVDFKQKQIKVEEANLNVKLQVWDTSGALEVDNVLKSKFKSSDGIILLYDTTNKESYDAIIKSWHTMVQQYAPPDVCKAVVGTKLDLTDKRQVNSEDAQKQAEKFRASWIEVSSKTSDNVEKLFMSIAAACVTRFLLKNKQQVSWKDEKNDKKCIVQ